MKILEVRRWEAWKKEVCIHEWWTASGDQNKYIADLLKSRYIRAHKSFEKKVSDSKGGSLNLKELRDMNMSKHIVMFYGFAIECYLKAYIVKEKILDIFEENSFVLNKKFAKHDLITHLPLAVNRKITDEERAFLKKLERAIKSGKYPFEKKPETYSYTGGLDEIAKFSKKIIQQIKNNL